MFSQALKSAEGDGRYGILIDLRNNPGTTLSSTHMCPQYLCLVGIFSRQERTS